MNEHARGVRVAVGAIVLCGALGLAACSGTPSSGRTSSSASSGPGSVSSQRAQQILQQVRAANLQDARVSVEHTIAAPQGKITASSSGALDLHPYAFNWTTTTQGPGINLETQEVLANSTLYVKESDEATWYQVSASELQAYLGANVGASQALTTSPAEWLNLANPSYVGAESVNGTPAYHVRGTVQRSAQGSGSITYTEDLWVNQSTSRPLKLVLGAAMPGSANQQVTFQQTMTFSQWNQGVSIAAPPASAIKR